MLQRFRHLVRRWPGLLLALAATAFVSQGVAGALSWCLHGGETSHVTASVGPCHLEAPDAAPAGHSHDRCHGSSHHGTHVAVATDAATGSAPAMPAAPASPLWFYAPVSGAAAAGAWHAGLRASRPGGLQGPRPRLSGAIPGDSTRLLI